MVYMPDHELAGPVSLHVRSNMRTNLIYLLSHGFTNRIRWFRPFLKNTVVTYKTFQISASFPGHSPIDPVTKHQPENSTWPDIMGRRFLTSHSYPIQELECSYWSSKSPVWYRFHGNKKSEWKRNIPKAYLTATLGASTHPFPFPHNINLHYASIILSSFNPLNLLNRRLHVVSFNPQLFGIFPSKTQVPNPVRTCKISASFRP